MATDALLKRPEIGQIWIDGYDHGCEWLIEAVGAETVYMVMLRDGKRSQNTQEWPLNRWRALVNRQGIRPASSRKAR